MKFQKINENKIQCYISSEELVAQGVVIKDLVDNQDKATKFLKSVLEEANNAVGFHTGGRLLNVQISVLSNESLSIIISDDEDAIIKSLFSEMKSRLESVKKMFKDKDDKNLMSKEGPKKLEDIFSPIIKEQQQGDMDIKLKEFLPFDIDMDDFEEEEEETEKDDSDKEKNAHIKTSLETSNMTHFSYWVEIDNLDRCIELSKSMEGMKEVPNKLYKLNGKYYLNLKLSMKKLELIEFICKTLEFGDQIYNNRGLSIGYILEHGKVLIKKDALSVLRKL